MKAKSHTGTLTRVPNHGRIDHTSAASKRRRRAEDEVQLQSSRKTPGLQKIRDPITCVIQNPKPVRPSSTPWFLGYWLDAGLNHPISHCRSRSAPCGRRQCKRQEHRPRSASTSRMSQRKSLSGSIGRPKSEQSGSTAPKSSVLSVSAADYRSHAENHGCVWKKAGPLPQHIGHTVNEILTRPRDSPPMTDDEAR